MLLKQKPLNKSSAYKWSVSVFKDLPRLIFQFQDQPISEIESSASAPGSPTLVMVHVSVHWCPYSKLDPILYSKNKDNDSNEQRQERTRKMKTSSKLSWGGLSKLCKFIIIILEKNLPQPLMVIFSGCSQSSIFSGETVKCRKLKHLDSSQDLRQPWDAKSRQNLLWLPF